ncbi:GNAT family N-acetyltransferase, partial [Inconstantimicrobium porci]|uniref:GNAT family N-acetyltransferase n=1 Tax=Inconstantimicrobium porci TaxID=2652291 RepID=UPI00240A7057
MIETERVILRRFKEEDIKDLNEYCSQEGVGEMAGWKHHKSMLESKSILNMFMKSREQYAIVYKENNKVIGHIGIHKDSEEGRADTKELGYVLNKDYWGKGIMTEVVQAVLEYLFKGNVVD